MLPSFQSNPFLRRAAHWLPLMVLVSSAGCGAGVKQFADAMSEAEKLQEQQAGLANLEGVGEVSEEHASGLHVSVNAAPEQAWQPSYPNRVDPFEFEIEFEEDTPLRGAEALVIELTGIVGQADPRAMLRVNGKSRLLAADEHWGDIEVLEIDYPNVRLRVDGVSKTWSLLGNRRKD